jgi:hypothetical protein
LEGADFRMRVESPFRTTKALLNGVVRVSPQQARWSGLRIVRKP